MRFSLLQFLSSSLYTKRFTIQYLNAPKASQSPRLPTIQNSAYKLTCFSGTSLGEAGCSYQRWWESVNTYLDQKIF
jgi:hypothetical protein